MIRRTAIIFFLAAVAAGCGGKPPETPPTPPSSAPDAPGDTPREAMIQGRIKAVDLAGRPLSGMVPIATTTPNAFDQPVSAGAVTGPDGFSSIQFPGDQHLYLRVWDPNLAYFPNNFYEVFPGEGSVAGNMTISMAPSAALRAQLFRADGSAAANENAGLMMIHPTRGPWWPAETDTNQTGDVLFQPLPPGSFVLRFKILSGGQIEHPEIMLPPGETIDLGSVVLY